MPDCPPEPTVDQPASLRVLLAEDDAPSRLFLESALRELDCRVHACADGNAALAAARESTYDLLVLDCRMPGAGAVQVLRALRGDASAASHASAAFASSAELPSSLRAELRAAGFANALLKPLSLDVLRQALHPLRTDARNGSLPGFRPGNSPDDLPGNFPNLTPPNHAPSNHVPQDQVSQDQILLDQVLALRNSGDQTTIAALRTLFTSELQRLTRELDDLVSRPAELAERLHPLLASCGFCGARALGERSLALKQQLDRGVDPRVVLEPFRQCMQDTLHALDQTCSGPRGTP